MVSTRFNIAHVVGLVEQFMGNLGQSHYILMKKIFCYLKGIICTLVCALEKTLKILLRERCILTKMFQKESKP
jgi:hypothetical protein